MDYINTVVFTSTMDIYMNIVIIQNHSVKDHNLIPSFYHGKTMLLDKHQAKYHIYMAVRTMCFKFLDIYPDFAIEVPCYVNMVFI